MLVLITEVSSIQRSLNTLQYYTGTQNGVLILEVSAIQRVVIERFHCTCMCTCIYMYVCTCILVCGMLYGIAPTQSTCISVVLTLIQADMLK